MNRRLFAARHTARWLSVNAAEFWRRHWPLVILVGLATSAAVNTIVAVVWPARQIIASGWVCTSRHSIPATVFHGEQTACLVAAAAVLIWGLLKLGWVLIQAGQQNTSTNRISR